MADTIFYSWQSDLPAAGNKNFLWDCLIRAVKELNKDSICVEAERDTQGVSGSPDIAQTIFAKIDQASVFVADISFVNKRGFLRKKERLMPNPNVMMELGYAAKTLGWNRVICLFNTDYGNVEDLPFDLKFRRVTTYHLRGAQKPEVRKDIVRAMKDSVLTMVTGEGIAPKAKDQEQVKEILFATLLHGMEQAWKMHVRSELSIYGPDDYAIITDSHIQMLQEIRTLLSEREYRTLHDMLYLFKYMYVETEDKGSGEFCQDFITKYMDDVYVEYFAEMAELPIMQFVKEEAYEVLQGLRPLSEQEQYTCEKRTEDGSLVYQSDGDYRVAYDKSGQLLCEGTVSENGEFTGWKTEYNYIGQFKEGLWHGDGVQYYVDFTDNHIAQKKSPKRAGRWEKGCLVEGTLYGTLLHKEQDGYAYEPDSKDLPMLIDDFEAHQRIRNIYADDDMDECQNYYSADMTLKDGEYDIIEGSVRPVCKTLGGVLELYCESCKAADGALEVTSKNDSVMP